ncbi:MAG: aminotransferase class V-fold PLP-dependent enzyme [Gloeocapsa sp. DLM2.Bin57]|nr:MAG: aminotransferase class V-fold PLP-dependent enzyme [Gloeocapsa sp. DLM2.Bin57]
MSHYNNINLYKTPRYTEDLGDVLKEFATSTMWDDWDLDGLLVDVPHKFAKKMGAEYGIFCCTGTAGLHASLMALELLPGDEIVVPCMTFIRAITPLVHLGLIPVLADIDTQTGNLDPESLKSVIGPKTRAVIVVHMWGIPADIRRILNICKEKGLYLVEDFSHAHFSKHEDGTVGSFGKVSFASLQRQKTLSVGEGGLIVTSDKEIYERLQSITSPGSFKGTPNFKEFSGFGLNFRMSPFSAIVASYLFDQVDEIVTSRATHAKIFDRILSDLSTYFSPPFVPNYSKEVSAYSYKPVLREKITLEKLILDNNQGLWKFNSFSYDHILASPFWRKSRAHYPFALQIYPKTPVDFPNYVEYIKGRVSISIPTVGKDYWSPENIDKWRDSLIKTINTSN